ncbi:MAG: anti-sigma factor [Actinomycetota bacterium]|jgi:anti-sigma factor RsiW|nr:anti-sigma factor [Actinomycetota bacterium]
MSLYEDRGGAVDGRELTHEEIQELLGVYALDALDPDEADIVRVHLLSCPRCAAEVAAHHEVSGMLANSGGGAPEALWEGIAGRLASGPAPWERLASRLDHPADPDAVPRGTDEAGPGRPGRGAGPCVPGAAGQPMAAPGGDGSAQVVPIAAARRRGRAMFWAVSVVAAAAAVLVAVLGIQVAHLDRQVSQMQAAASQPALTRAADMALENPTSRRIALQPPVGSHGMATATIVLTSSGTGYVLASGLAKLPPDRTYQLWGMMDGTAISLGLLGAKPDVVAFSVDPNAPISAFAVTDEHAGGVVRSTRQPVVEGSLLT